MDDKNLKQQLEQYVKSNGLKYRYIASQLNISESMLCHWRYDRRRLTQATQQQLKKLIRG